MKLLKHLKLKQKKNGPGGVEHDQCVSGFLEGGFEVAVVQVNHFRGLFAPRFLRWRRRRWLFRILHELDDWHFLAEGYVELELALLEVLDGWVATNVKSRAE